MPKMKTNTGAKKRFRVTAKGKIKRRHTNMRHILTKKETKRKRHLRDWALVSDADTPRVKRLLAM